MGCAVRGCAGLRGWRGPCIPVAVVPASLGRAARGSAGGSRGTPQMPEQQCGGPLSRQWSYFAGKAAIWLRWWNFFFFFRTCERPWGKGRRELGEVIGEVHSGYKICQFLFLLLKRIILVLR